MTIQLVGEWPQDLADAATAAHTALLNDPQFDLSDGIVNLQLVDDSQITELNTQYTGNAYATDVLTFPYAQSDDRQSKEDPTIADIVISQETAERQAAAAGTELSDEVGLLTLHGLLHATGYDHGTQQDRDRLEAIQQRVMAAAHLTYRDFTWHQ